ncbi:MAG TPA: MGMT family protein [Thermotogota bacterium]|nr:MGMT family protein [Thermotogota bacterium]HPJ87856.1 MGMT family protein [Thermotogota bacterium]HPR94949.1 MGMT family protein [Thermotogota bacterium]
MTDNSVYEEIYSIIRNIPKGKVASYGMIAAIHGGCTARMVGFALSRSTPEKRLPWHRVINSQGKISLGDEESKLLQRKMLEAEGIIFKRDRVDIKVFGWKVLE